MTKTSKKTAIRESRGERRTSRGYCYYYCGLKKNQSTPRPSEHPLIIVEKKMSKRLGGIKEGCNYKTSSWYLSRFPDADNIGSRV